MGETAWGDVGSGTDTDLWVFELYHPASLNVDVTYDGDEALSLELIYSGEVIYSAGIDGIRTGLYPGKYYLKVSGGNGVYSLKLYETNEVREYEPNNGIGSCTTIKGTNTPIKADLYSSEDQDWYGFYVNQGGIIDGSIESETGVDVYVYTVSGTQVGNWSSVGNFNCILSSGTYFLKVVGSDSLEYTLTLSGDISPIEKLLDIGIELEGEGESIKVGDSLSFKLYGYFVDGSVKDLTEDAVWKSLNEEVLNIGEGGKGSALSEGSCTVIVTYEGRTASYVVGVGGEEKKQGYGNLIIVAGGGISNENLLKDITQDLCDQFYMKFKLRGFNDEDIYYLNPIKYKDLDGDGFDDQIVDEWDVTKGALLDAIKAWAKKYPTDGPLYIYFNDHGANDLFKVNSGEILTASELNSALDGFQSETGRSVVLIIEACHSGTFLDNLSSTEYPRVILTSSDEGLSFLGDGGIPSFSLFLINALYKGKSIYDAYNYLKNELEAIGTPYKNQSPQISYSDIIDPSSLYVVGNFKLAPVFPEIVEVNIPDSIEYGSDLKISAKVTGVGGGKVWARIKPVGYEPPPVGEEFETPSIEVPSVELIDEKDLVYDDVFEGVYSGFKDGGDYTKNSQYEVVIYAKDDKGNVTKSAIHYVTLTGGSLNQKPEADFTYSISFTDQGIKVKFKDLSFDQDGKIGGWNWQFGDGSQADKQNPEHIYSDPGTYTVTLTITDDMGETDTISKQIEVVEGISEQLEIQLGWNLLGTRIGFSVENIFSDDSKYQSIWKWKDNNWMVYLPSFEDKGIQYAKSKGFGLLQDINSGEGFWVNSIGSGTISISGIPSQDTTLQIDPGWNLISLKVNKKKGIDELISGNEDKIMSVWKWLGDTWAVYLQVYGQDTTEQYAESKGFEVLKGINPGEGFWINATSALELLTK